MQFFDAFLNMALLFVTFLAEKGRDKELSDPELDMVKDELESLLQAVETEIAQRQTAYEDAGGKDTVGDKNKSERI